MGCAAPFTHSEKAQKYPLAPDWHAAGTVGAGPSGEEYFFFCLRKVAYSNIVGSVRSVSS